MLQFILPVGVDGNQLHPRHVGCAYVPLVWRRTIADAPLEVTELDKLLSM